MRNRTLSRGVTLIEMMVVLVIIAIVATIGIPSALKNKSYAEDTSAVSKAVLIDNAKSNFAMAVGRRTAETQWLNADSSEARYALIKPYLSYPQPTLADFTVAGYTLTLDALFATQTGAIRNADQKDLRL